MIEIPRFSENLALNNVALVAVATTLVVAALVLTTVVTVWFGRWAARSSGVDVVESGVERFWRPFRIAVSAVGLVVVLAACGLLAASIWKSIDLQTWVDQGSSYVTWSAALLFLRVVGVLIAVVVGSLYLRRAATPLLGRMERRLQGVEVLSGHGETVTRLVTSLKPLVNIVLVYLAFYLGSGWLGLPAGLRWFVVTIIFTVLVLNGARTVVLLVHLLTGSLDRVFANRFAGGRFEQYYNGVRGLWPLAQRSFEAVAYLAAATLVVGEFDILESAARFGPILINLIAIFFFARVVVELTRVVVVETLTRGGDLADETLKRRNTLVYLVQSVLKWVIYFGATLLMLKEVGIDPTPFLAGAGIVGLTLGLGAQKLVNDMVSGFFILFEGTMLNGDYVRVGDAEGVVEGVYLRITQIRDSSGRLHTIRNGQIERLISYSRDYINAIVEVGVAYESDLNKVFEVIRLAGKALKEAHPTEVLAEPRILGVDAFLDSAIEIRTATKVMPGMHLPIERAFRKLLKEHFNAHGVEIPYPRLVHLHATRDTRN